MSDEELIESLRLWNRDDAADRIEELEREQSRLHTQCDGLMQAAMNNGQALILAEAKLAKAVEALRKSAILPFSHAARIALAELEGKE
jgi:hypothetical protein